MSWLMRSFIGTFIGFLAFYRYSVARGCLDVLVWSIEQKCPVDIWLGVKSTERVRSFTEQWVRHYRAIEVSNLGARPLLESREKLEIPRASREKQIARPCYQS